jgi:hypothetical protein
MGDNDNPFEAAARAYLESQSDTHGPVTDEELRACLIYYADSMREAVGLLKGINNRLVEIRKLLSPPRKR